ncbi:MAG: hypothetical protein KDK70_41295, partial [Myxococcales bacterium]|nr:hypothetical protein [Myxococcales bacterium]
MPSSTTPGVERLDPVQREVVAPTHRAHVDALRFVEAHAGEGARVEVDLTLFLALPVEFDGLQTAARGVTFERSRVLLRVDGEDLPAVPQEGEARWVQIPPSGARRVQVTFVFAVDARPADAVLRMQVESAWSALRLIGPPRLDDGRQAVDVLAVDPAGRAPRAAGLLEVDGEEVTREAPVLPWRGPAGQGARLSVEGFEPVDLALGDGPVQVVHLVPDTPAGALQASFADLWRDLPLPSPPPLMPELIAQLHTPEEALEA